MLGFIFNKWVRNTYRGWWMRYNYLTSAALDVGLALCGLIIFFFVLLPGGKMPKWWGTEIGGKTADGAFTAVRKFVAEGEYFGPRTWKW
jgi:hypothetical protein